ncbi:hypothetical protein D3C72_970210 [compost metagenome]
MPRCEAIQVRLGKGRVLEHRTRRAGERPRVVFAERAAIAAVAQLKHMVLSRADHGLQQHGLCLAGGVVNLFAAYERRGAVHVIEGDRPFAELTQHGLVRARGAEGRRRPGRLGSVSTARAGKIVARVAVGIAC